MLAATSVPIIASGGVASLEDLHQLAALEVSGRRLGGAITGTAVYEDRFTIEGFEDIPVTVQRKP